VRRIHKRPRASVVAVLVVTAALALAVSGCGGGGGGGGSTSETTSTTIGKGEGSLNVVEWPLYTDKSFAKPFEQRTGCTIHRKDAGTSNQMFALMHGNGGGGGGQYDLVSASGDASLRLINAGDVQPIDINQIPSWKNFLPQFKSPSHNTVDGKHYGVSVQWGPNTLIYNTQKVKPAPTGWGDTYGSKYNGNLTAPNNPIQIADAALYLMQTKPSLGIKDPYELTKDQLTAASQLLMSQKPLLKRYWNYAADEITSFKNGDVWMGAGWPYQTLALQADKQPIKEIVPLPTTGWADTWMLAAKAPHPNCALRWMQYVTTPKVEAQQALVFGETPVNPRACPFMDKLQKGSCAAYHLNQPASYYSKIKFWKTPIPQCGWNNSNDCMDYNAWVQAWTKITG
jgi:putative spermidine/putrescine transport system substrate-binding protein